jgi:hypothetical protein
MFDVETSGIFRNSQIVQMSTADIAGNGKISAGLNTSFKSPQLNGLMYGEGNPFSNLFASGKVVGSENGGKDFLDEGVKLINNLVESNSVIAGHNINFDIQKLTGTMKQMGGYSSHSEAKAAIERLHSRIKSGETTLVDTLEYNRSYMNDLVNKAVDDEFTRTGITRTDSKVAELHRQFMYSPETMADVKIGGGAAYSSVEAISLNTDLTARIVTDAQNGDEAAALLLDKIQRGSHLSDTDTLLQSFIIRYTTSDKERLQLARPGGGRSSAVYEALSEDAKQIADNMRRKIYRSSANVPTKNIADVQHLSEATFNYLLTDEGTKNVTMFADKDWLDALKQLGIAYDRVLALEKADAFDDIKEFVAYGMSHPDMQEFLMQTKGVYAGETTESSLFNKFVQGIRKFFEMGAEHKSAMQDLVIIDRKSVV